MGVERKSRKVLVVDDEDHIAMIIRNALVHVEGGKYQYEVVIAHNGVEALEQVKKEVPNMIIIDNLMPVMDGFALLKSLQSNPATKLIPVMILLEVQPDESADALLFKSWVAGVSSALTKPFSPREVTVFVGRILETIDGPDDTEESVWDP